MGTHLFCTQRFGVRLPVCPLFEMCVAAQDAGVVAVAEGYRRLAVDQFTRVRVPPAALVCDMAAE